MIDLMMCPADSPLTWKEFCNQKEPFSIAIDGYVNAAPQFTQNGPYANFDHHHGVDRLSTRATCAQVLMSIRLGLFSSFRRDGEPCAKVFANDCDEDVCLAWYLLSNGVIADQVVNPRLNRLVHLVDTLDTTAGAYPYPADMGAIAELAWIYEPYRRARLSGDLDRRQPDSYTGIVTDVCHRIERNIMGNGESITPDTTYDRIGGGSSWSMVRERGAQARNGMSADGILAYVSVRDRPDGKFTYVVGRVSEFVPFRVLGLLEALDKAEDSADDHWGGSNLVGGSPRNSGSKLKPTEVIEIINDLLAQSTQSRV